MSRRPGGTRRRWWRSVGVLLVAATAPGAAACGTSAADEVGVADLADVAEESRAAPHRFELVDQLGGARLVVRGVVADDHRYRATVEVGGAPAYEELVIDDARYLRLVDPRLYGLDPSAPPPGLEALATGGWVVDPHGAPPEFATEAPAGLVALAPTTALAGARFLEELPSLLDGTIRRRWNPDAASYLAREDRFPPHEGDGVRFDALPPAYDRDAVFSSGVPARHELERRMRWAAVWVQGRQVTRVEVLVDPPDSLADDIARVRRLEAERTGADLPAGGAGGDLATMVDDVIPVRRQLTYLRWAADDNDLATVAAPSAAVAVEDLAALTRRVAAVRGGS